MTRFRPLTLKFVMLHMTGILVAFFGIQAFGQEETAPSTEQIKEAYNRFNYNAVVSLAIEALEVEPPLPRQEQVVIYTYLAFAHVALGKRDEAVKDFEVALELDPTLTLDPMYVSPKIIALFDEVKSAKVAGREKQPVPIPIDKDMRFEGAWRSLLLPGWGQLHKGQTKKAIAIFTIQAINVSALVYAHLQMEHTHDEYLRARDEDDIETTYNRYNTFYKLRYSFALSTAVVWLYSHIDAALTAPAFKTDEEEIERTSFLSPKITADTISLMYTIRF